MIKLERFKPSDFDVLISWIDSRELLLQIAGTYFAHPLTTTQLQHYLDNKSSLAFNVVEASSNKIIGHSEIIMLDNRVCNWTKF